MSMNFVPNNAPNVQAPASKAPVMPVLSAPCGCEPYICMLKCAHAYVPFQYFGCIYPPMKALEKGTMFQELDRPYGLDPEYTVDA